MSNYVLMIQSDPDDLLITESAMKNLQLSTMMYYANDFNEVEQTISEKGYPVVILINDRGASHPGGAMLVKIKSYPQYSHIPVVILGEMSTPEYIRRCYREGASSFITKPSTVKETQDKIEKFFSYWLEVADVN